MRKFVITVFAGLCVLAGLAAFGTGRLFSVVKIGAPWVLLSDTTMNLEPVFREETGTMLLGAWACPFPRCPTDARLLIGLDKSRNVPADDTIEMRMRTMVWQPAFNVPDTRTVLAATNGGMMVQHRSGIKFADVIVRVRPTPAGVAYYILQTSEDNRVQAERMLDRLMPTR